ncbi:hypothetical protein GCM10009504_46720 [Pseudomonas laurentiana]|uniref:hypothetical protein n=1 Tax=Pseudomonas laurentiana TaxID=2364649 RepID=UPI00167BFD4F|nr:hypothetical protein [Pseudomonas laurentiana]GGU85097.1 hypothetical protein GCM10009504_46720 [Pseudomonas laurentiana]
MSQFDFGAIDPNSKSGPQLALDLNKFRDALNSGHRGSARPAYAQAGMQWVRETSSTQWDLCLFDGDTDFVIRSVNPTTNTLLQIPSSQISGIGTSAAATLTISNTDEIAGRVIKVGDGGLRGTGVTRNSAALLDVVRGSEFFFNDQLTGANNPFSGYGSGIHVSYPAAGLFWDIFAGVQGTSTRAFLRTSRSASVINSPVELYHTGNISAFMQTLMPAADAAAAKVTLGVVDGIGVNQTIQDVTATRALATTHTNSTGRPILVWVSATQTSSAAPGAFNATVSGSLLRGTSTYGSGQGFSISFVVPNGATYSVAFSGTSYDTLNWKEYR